MNEKLKKLLEAIQEKMAAQKALLDKGDACTEEELSQIQTLDVELDGMEKQAEGLRAAEEARQKAAARSARFVAPTTDDAVRERSTDVVVLGAHGPVTSFKGADAAKKAHLFGNVVLGGLFKWGPGLEFCRRQGIEIRAQSEGLNTAGAVLVPTELMPDFIQLMEEFGVFRRLSRVRPMGRDTASIPRRTGGLTAYHTAEGAAITESSKSWDSVELSAKKLTALAKYSTELSEDALIDIGNDLAEEIANAFVEAEDADGFLGDGSSTYGGILGVIEKMKKTVTDAGGTWTTDAHKIYNPSVVLAAGNAFSEVTLANLNAVKAAVKRYRKRANNVWMCHSAFYNAVCERLIAAVGGVTASEVMTIIGNDPENPRLLGRPVVYTEVMIEAEANSGVPLLYGDLALASTFGDRRQITLAQSEHSDFANDQIAIRGTERYDISVHDVGVAHASDTTIRQKGPIGMLALMNA